MQTTLLLTAAHDFTSNEAPDPTPAKPVQVPDASQPAVRAIESAPALPPSAVSQSLFGKSWFVCDQANRRSMIRIMAIWIIAAALVSVRS